MYCLVVAIRFPCAVVLMTIRSEKLQKTEKNVLQNHFIQHDYQLKLLGDEPKAL
jgi:hypothetical protein